MSDSGGAAAAPSERFHHLDLLRGALMLLGVFVHASHADYDAGAYEWLRFASGSFRMACFFLISGFFAPVLFTRERGRGFLWRRWVTLGVPALFCVFALNPRALGVLNAYYATAPTAVFHALNWHLHVWFLFVLCLYAACSRPLWSLVKWACDGATRAQRVRSRLLLAGCLGVAVLGLKSLEKWGPLLPGYVHYQEILEPAVQFIPFFSFGLLMRRSSAAFEFAHARPAAWALAAPLLLVLRYQLEQHPITTTPQHLAHLSVDFATAFAVSFALLGLLRRLIREPRPWVRFVSESAYTVYVVHFSLIAECLLATQRWGLPIWLRAACAAAVALGGGFAVHHWLVRRVPLAALVLNGRLPARRASEAEPAPERAERPSFHSIAPAPEG